MGCFICIADDENARCKYSFAQKSLYGRPHRHWYVKLGAAETASYARRDGLLLVESLNVIVRAVNFAADFARCVFEFADTATQTTSEFGDTFCTKEQKHYKYYYEPFAAAHAAKKQQSCHIERYIKFQGKDR